MRTAEQRIAHYNARMVSSQIDPVLSAMNVIQKANFRAYANEFVPKQEQLRALLSDADVATIFFLKYEAFNHQMYHLWLTAAGASAVKTATALVEKYESWGSDPALLRSIAAVIWNIIVPAGP